MGEGAHHEDIKLSLVDAVTELIAAHGIEGFTVSDVTGKVGIALGSLYRYFDSKEQLIEAAILNHRAETSDLRALIDKGEHDPIDLIGMFLSRNYVTMSHEPARAGFEHAVIGHPFYAKLIAADATALLELNPPSDELVRRRSDFMVSLLKGFMIAAHEYAADHPEVFDDELALVDAMTIIKRVFGET